MIQRYIDARGMSVHLFEQRQSGVDREVKLREQRRTLSRELSELEGNQYRKAFGRGVDALQSKLTQQQQQTQSAPPPHDTTRDEEARTFDAHPPSPRRHLAR